MNKKVVGVIDYQAGNIKSVMSAVEYTGAIAKQIKRSEELGDCSHIILPGVGAFGYCVDRLRGSDIFPSVEKWALEQCKPILGICVGMQLMADHSTENGKNMGLGWVGGKVEKIKHNDLNIRVPHVGWNDVLFEESFGDFKQGDKADFYFDHSFAYKEVSNGDVVGRSEHGESFAAIIRKNNIIAVQFHPEKSQAAGLRLLNGFLSL